MCKMRFFTLICFSALMASNVFADLPEPVDAHELNRSLGRGVNLGNVFESPREGAWGLRFDPAWLDLIRDLGFDHVRIPVRWDTPERASQEPPHLLDPAFLDRMTAVVDAALARGLIVILNMHHHDSLFEDPPAHQTRFLSQWRQLSAHFQTHSPSLLFEVLNEPHGNLTPERWNLLFRDALAEIRRNNPTRVVLLGTPQWGGPQGASRLSPPPDPYLILTVHYYQPFSFTHQGAGWVNDSEAWLGTRWQDTVEEREAVRRDFLPVFQLARKHNLPVHVGEFGAYSRADFASRVRWTHFLARWFEEQGFSWAYWEFAAGFGLYDPAAGELREDLVDALLHRPMPPPARGRMVYQYHPGSDHPPPTLLVNHAEATAASRDTPNGLKLHIQHGGEEDWHVQMVHAPMSLRNGGAYELTARLYADPPRDVVVYTGRNQAPWDAYTPYHRVEVPPDGVTLRIPFIQEGQTDKAARVVLDLTPKPGEILLDHLQLLALPR